MSQLVLEIPETLHQQLEQLAQNEGVSLSQYLVFALTRQAQLAYSVKAARKPISKNKKTISPTFFKVWGNQSLKKLNKQCRNANIANRKTD